MRARKRNIDPVCPADRELLIEVFDGMCAYCQRNPATTMDHIVPVAKGGQSVRGNLLPACGSCNSRKYTKDLEPFLSTLTSYSDLIGEELCMLEVL